MTNVLKMVFKLESSSRNDSIRLDEENIFFIIYNCYEIIKHCAETIELLLLFISFAYSVCSIFNLKISNSAEII